MESWVGLSIIGLGVLNLTKELCFLALALSLSQSLFDQSEWDGKGCGACCLQKEHKRPNLSHAFWGIGLYNTNLIHLGWVSSQGIDPIGLYWVVSCLWLDHKVLTLPWVHFLGCLGGFAGIESVGLQGE